jgi:hypothetical protein
MAVITVESVIFAVADPPPDTLTLFARGEAAFAATFTVTVIAGKLAPAASVSLRVQLLTAVPGHVHPEPAIDTSVSPEGTVSVTVTTPLVGPAKFPFLTVTV